MLQVFICTEKIYLGCNKEEFPPQIKCIPIINKSG